MKTTRRFVATAAIGLLAAGVLGFGAHTASATPVTSDNEISSVDCNYYAKKAKEWQAIAKKSNGLAAEAAYKKAADYAALYRDCVGG